MTTEVKPLSRSEREALIKDKAGWVITILAALLAINTLMGGSNSSKVLNNTIDANNTWAFYQAKSIKQTLAEQSYEDAVRNKDTKKAETYKAKIDRYESDPKTGEGKKELISFIRLKFRLLLSIHDILQNKRMKIEYFTNRCNYLWLMNTINIKPMSFVFT